MLKNSVLEESLTCNTASYALYTDKMWTHQGEESDEALEKLMLSLYVMQPEHVALVSSSVIQPLTMHVTCVVTNSCSMISPTY
jgi:hypothetical protein